MALESGIDKMAGDWLHFGFVVKVLILGFLGGMGVTCFFVFAIIFHVLDLREMKSMFLRKKGI